MMQEVTHGWPPVSEYPKMVSFAIRWCRDKDDAIDLLHDSLIAVATSSKQVENPSAYCYGILKKMAISKGRRKRRFEVLPITLSDDRMNTFQDTLKRERVDLVLQHLERAQPMGQRVLGRMLDGQDAEQIMAAEHLTATQLTRETYRAKVALKEHLNA